MSHVKIGSNGYVSMVLEVNRDLWYRIYWYSLINLLLDVKYYHQRGRFTEMNQDILKISELINELNF